MFSPGVERALRVALEAHHGQLRKGLGEVPYAVHPLHVALVLRGFEADEMLIQAALLHDVVEDSADWTLERLAEHFGPVVAGIVGELSEDKSRGWRERKEASIEAVARLSPGAVLVKACDKLHNLTSLVDDLRAHRAPEELWRAFSGGRSGTLDVARRMVAELEARVPVRLARALRGTLEELERRAAS